MIRVVILGFGKVGRHLAIAFNDAPEIQVVQIYNRSARNEPVELTDIPFTDDLSRLEEADIYIMAVPDDFIGTFSDEIPKIPGILVHTSGGVDLSAINPKHQRGVFYPLQSFSETGKARFKEIPMCLEAENPEALEKLTRLARSISEKVETITSEERAKLHLAAVFVNNFVNHLYYISDQYLAVNDLDFELLKPLINETARKMETLIPVEAQTGPAVRKDQKTIQKHLELLNDSPFKNLYIQLTTAIQETHGKKL